MRRLMLRFNSQMVRGYVAPGAVGDALGHQIVRYLNSAHLLAYVGLSSAKEYDWNFFCLLNCKYRLLDQRDLETVRGLDPECGGTAYRELLVWSISILGEMRREGVLTNEQARSIEQSILGLRSALAKLYDYDFQPIPFAYYNLLSWILALFCKLAIPNPTAHRLN